MDLHLAKEMTMRMMVIFVLITPSPKHQLSSPSALNAPSKSPSTKGTSSSSIYYIPKLPTSSTSPLTNGYLNSLTSPPLRVPSPPPTQENASMVITLTLSPITPLDVQFNTPSPSSPIFGHPIPWNLLEAHGDSFIVVVLYQCLVMNRLNPNSNFTFISDRQKGIIPVIKTVYPSAEHIYCLRHIHESMKQGVWASIQRICYGELTSFYATNVRDFEKYMLLKTMNPKAHEWLNKIPAEHWARSYFSVGGRDKPVITLLLYIKEYCIKRIVNVQGVIDKCTSPLTPTATKIMESIKKEAHLMKVVTMQKPVVVHLASTTKRPALVKMVQVIRCLVLFISLSAADDEVVHYKRKEF
ncbi:hypothetical protein Tco_0079456 [Tanacetum coccineum]